MKHMRISMRSDIVSLPLPKLLPLAARLGCQGIELDVRRQIRPSHFSDSAVRQLRKMLDDNNLQVSSLRFMTRRAYDDPTDLERRIEATKEAMQLAYRLGCRSVVNRIANTLPETPEENPLLCQVLSDLGKFGAKVGAFLVAETSGYPCDRMIRFLEHDAEVYFPVAFNPGLVSVHGHDMVENVTQLGERIELIHAVDGVIDINSVREGGESSVGQGRLVPIGQGSVDFLSLVAMMESSGYGSKQGGGFWVVGREQGDLSEITQGIQYLKEVSVDFAG